MTTDHDRRPSMQSMFCPGPLSMLWQLAQGRTPNFSSDTSTSIAHGQPNPVGWCSYTHRCIQMLDAIRIPAKQRRYVLSDRFELRIDTDFERVVRYCADPARDSERITWLGEGLLRGFVRLHEMGFAHSFEAWRGDELAGGWFGVRLGTCVSCESMFHLADQAGKFAYVRGLLHLRERGFEFVDVTFSAPHFERWGARWVPQWKFTRMLASARRAYPSARSGEGDASPLPWTVRTGLSARRLARILRRGVSLPLRKCRSLCERSRNPQSVQTGGEMAADSASVPPAPRERLSPSGVISRSSMCLPTIRDE